ncbi:SGNH/GDSL hydrolase family protein [Allorhizocola rhizosphaerae]|uniref:SGNH/GDSL hydrolase family protein n=1 Tax=Allorhizocola rhizosphaerae TaxID=1872709 RepID=UPI000E3B9694|nr:SGNH/GDSL hydrolase family protein [Allorhizocola rhizosphaerae]
MAWSRYVALGDSFTEGLDDPYPDGMGTGYRGWADLVAAHLNVEYANLAIRGRLFDAVVAEQVEPALAMQADLISFAAGGNDILRRRCDPPALMARFAKTIELFRGTGADVLVFRFANVLSRLPGNRMIGPRVRYLNQAVGEITEQSGARLVDLWSDPEYDNPALWSVDRLHLSAAGHLRTAAHVLAALDVSPPSQWWDVPGWPPPRSWAAARAADAAWAARHLAPWIKRRLTGRSSGDGIQAKRPSLRPMA